MEPPSSSVAAAAAASHDDAGTGTHHGYGRAPRPRRQDDRPRRAAAIANVIVNVVLVDVVLVLLALLGLYIFASSFFLSKHSLPSHRSSCDDNSEASYLLLQLGVSQSTVRALQTHHLVHGDTDTDNGTASTRNGCWMDRRADAVVILLVDALRIDFVQQLTRSIQSRLRQHPTTATTSTSSRLFRFVADPPTVTTQRIKALTTGGLPTFADLSSNFGGATVEDDNWLYQLLMSPLQKRGYDYAKNNSSSSAQGASGGNARIGFVGDDTWLDLYPHSFAEAHPYPSFNTRDLDTVDNGCLHHLPSLLDHMRPSRHSSHHQDNNSDDDLEVAIVHFLGVDHVGHTYGPVNEHMDVKLAQMDETIDYVLTYLDNDSMGSSGSCRMVLVFGDHGMTGDGNHGGGTLEEVSAGLFVHATPGCGGLLTTTTTATPNDPHDDVLSIHQIDLVPTLSYLLGIPIPFANLGRVVTELLPPLRSKSTPHMPESARMAVAMALNAGQVWRYLDTYRHAYRSLPNLDEQLGPPLRHAVQWLEKAVNATLTKDASLKTVDESHDSLWNQAAQAFHHALGIALDLGQQAWTQFDTQGMVTGIVVLASSLAAFVLVQWRRSLSMPTSMYPLAPKSALGLPWSVESVLAFTYVLYHCGVLTFSNSYILEEQRSLQFAMGSLGAAIAVRWNSSPAYSRPSRPKDKLILASPSIPPALLALLIPVASRLHELLVSGHGLDPSIRSHAAHSAAAFVPCLVVLLVARWGLQRSDIATSRPHWITDSVSIAALGASWWEKRNPDPSRNGFVSSRLALAVTAAGLLPLLLGSRVRRAGAPANQSSHSQLPTVQVAIVSKLLILLMAVTGPSTAATVILYLAQVAALCAVHTYLSAIVTATLIKLITRHAFFATNHACFFNRLQYSAAFVATTEFNFFTGGLSLFLNTFGWEIAGILLCLALRRRHVWTCYVGMQLLEALCSCVSVSLLRRHLMVWDIYAPHFLFTSIFTILTCLSHVTSSILGL